ncbi:MAG: sulfite exporter TauE/SafE family protein [Patescibacteria group bacterium]
MDISIIICFFTTFLASATQSLVGFGFSLLAVAILVNFYSVQLVVAVVLLFNLIIDLVIWYRNRKIVQINKIFILFLASLFGMPIGVYILLIVNPDILKFFIGVIILLTAIAMIMGFKNKLKYKHQTAVFIGFLSGLLQGSVHVGGPPVALFFANQNMEKRIFRANIIAYFALLNIFTFLWFIYKGLINKEVIIMTGIFLPAVIIGLLLGIILHSKINENLFKKIILVIIALGGVSSILSAFNLF